jgi:uncharacterized protein
MHDPLSGPDVPPCVVCGACCFSTLSTYVRVTGDDYTRLGARAEDLVRFDGYRAYMRMREGRCAALAIDPTAARFVCTAYDERPSTCRDLGRGSPECAGERATKSGRPVATITRLLKENRVSDRSRG